MLKMTKKLFTEREIQILSNNLYVKSVSQKGITYTEEFMGKSITLRYAFLQFQKWNLRGF
ncbi:hypothetical protein CJ306_09720 [Bacillus cereus]|nr:hypothetical protein CJ306_09720 [Bacillus cereus]TFZ14609.1 hypothetical protein C6Y54_01255 [Bacillus cereus]